MKEKRSLKLLIIIAFLVLPMCAGGVSADVTSGSASNPNIPNSPTIKTHVDLPKHSSEVQAPAFTKDSLPKTGENQSFYIGGMGILAVLIATLIKVFSTINKNKINGKN
ncbi:LPXTG cell wall anchor domain-containing protein [Lactococcus lactis subsp. lactis]|uniref:LPXTG cell wall anchor domain-containing protein n=1 Tax=Lactococcus lactis TaxID=1358 RepID=UPI0021B06C11|nr:LPXTG cell wall anchor domain-containing protein [Lactococcus lactis]MCT0017338.1 LPXTG cell wall anchor domain-containing protein [Lactococcus lactis subsp. lactis]